MKDKRELSKDLQDLSHVKNRINRLHLAHEWLLAEFKFAHKVQDEIIDRMAIKNMNRKREHDK